MRGRAKYIGTVIALVTAALWPQAAQAQDSYCCNRTTGELGPQAKSVCLTKPNNVMMSVAQGDRGQLKDMCAELGTRNSQMLDVLNQTRTAMEAQISAMPPQAQEGMREGLLRLEEKARVFRNEGEVMPPAEGVRGGASSSQTTGGDDDDTPPYTPPVPDLSYIPVIPGGDAPLPQCCHVANKSFLGAMEPDVCTEEGGVPDTAENLEETEVCRSSGGGGGGQDIAPGIGGVMVANASAWDDEEFEENAGNADLERWQDENTPVDFMSHNVDDSMGSGNVSLLSTFRSSDAYTGQYSVRLKPQDLRTLDPGMNQVLSPPNVGAVTGLAACEGKCEKKGGAGLASDIVPFDYNLDEAPTHVCGVYKGHIPAGTQLEIGATFGAGENMYGFAKEGITRSSAYWRKVAVQIQPVNGAVPKSGKFGISMQMANSGGVMLGGFAMNVNTDVSVDSFHLCNPIGISAFHPKVLTGGSSVKIPDDEEESKGVQTFVNLDNDDEDEFFDNDDAENGVSNDDELVMLRMFAPKDTRGEVTFRAPDLEAGKYRLWNDANKMEPFADANSEDPIDIRAFLRPGIKEGVIERRVWVEALEPSEKPKDRIFEFVYNTGMSGSADITDTIVLTALQIDSIEFLGKGNGFDRNSSDDLDEDKNWPKSFSGTKSWRVFPGKSWEAPDGELNNKVVVKAALNVEPTRDIPIFFRSFDVDDPTADDNEVDKEEEAEDNRGKTPNKWGAFPDGKEVYRLLASKKEEEFEFEVTLHPGDNFRIAGAGDADALMALENDDTKLAKSNPQNTARIVDKHVFDVTDDASKSQHRQGKSRVSDVLTVWRKLHMEMDTMSNVQDNEIESVIVSYKNLGSGSVKNSLVAEVTLDSTIYAKLPANSKSNASGIKGSFLGGTANIEPWLTNNPYKITDNSGNASGVDTLTLTYNSRWGPMEASFENKKIIFRDDDFSKNGDPVPALDKSRLVDAFAPAYVFPTEDEITNATKSIPFRLNSKSDKPDDLKSFYVFENAAYEADPGLWTIYVLNAFQGILTEDGDGDGEGAVAGEADNTALQNNGQGLHIYQESGRELLAGHSGPGWRASDVVTHEIGHLFTGDHADEGLMWDPADGRNTGKPDERTQDFGPKTLDRIRNQDHP